jgi:hypothetical protein
MTSQSNFPEAHLPDAAAMSEAFSVRPEKA